MEKMCYLLQRYVLIYKIEFFIIIKVLNLLIHIIYNYNKSFLKFKKYNGDYYSLLICGITFFNFILIIIILHSIDS